MGQLHGQIKGIDGTTKWKPIEAILEDDGTYSIRVNTELVLDSGSVTISNLRVGSVNQTVSGSRWLKTLDDGTVVVATMPNDLLEGYHVTDTIDTGPFPRYHGYVDEDENWFIIEEGTISLRYFAGSGNYSAAWTARGSHTYLYYYEVF